jgi:hypothetical protein
MPNNSPVLGDDYKRMTEDVNLLRDINSSLNDLGLVIGTIPQEVTLSSFLKDYKDSIDRYSRAYTVLKSGAGFRVSSFLDNRNAGGYSGISPSPTAQSPATGDLSSMLNSLKRYLTENSLPQRYVDLGNPDPTLLTLSSYMTSVYYYATKIRELTDALGGVSGIGNAELAAGYEDAKVIAQSPVNEKKIEQNASLPEIQEVNKIKIDTKKEEASRFKGTVVAPLSPAFAKTNKGLLEKLAILGAPETPRPDRSKDIEDHNREKVRKKFGNIPFCDEEAITDSLGQIIFVKRSDLVEVTDRTGKKVFIKKEQQWIMNTEALITDAPLA